MDITLILWRFSNINNDDLNINAFVQDLRLEAILRAFKMVVNFPTHHSGSVIRPRLYKKELADAVQIRMLTEENIRFETCWL